MVLSCPSNKLLVLLLVAGILFQKKGRWSTLIAPCKFVSWDNLNYESLLLCFDSFLIDFRR